jgi:hypothetical protein
MATFQMEEGIRDCQSEVSHDVVFDGKCAEFVGVLDWLQRIWRWQALVAVAVNHFCLMSRVI